MIKSINHAKRKRRPDCLTDLCIEGLRPGSAIYEQNQLLTGSYDITLLFGHTTHVYLVGIR